MGQTVSLGACVSGGSIVRVMNTAGVFESYEFPVATADVMLKHPDHLVVHCAQTPGGRIGQKKINIMLPDQPLLPGEPYMLYPIPEKHRSLLARSKSFSMLQRQINSKDGEVSAAPEKKKGRRSALKLLVTRLHLVTLVASKIGSKSDKEKDEPLLQNEEKKKVPQPLEMPDYHWKPDLASIPESPLGFHSIPVTPRGLYKMDGISENQPYAVSYPGQTTVAVHHPTAIPTVHQ